MTPAATRPPGRGGRRPGSAGGPPTLDRDDLLCGSPLLLSAGSVTFVLPLATLLSKSFQDQEGNFVGLANYVHYFATPALSSRSGTACSSRSISTAIVLPLAFPFAYALQRSCMRWKLFQALALIPLLAPSLLPAISLIYLFGNQGLLKGCFGGSIYGPTGSCLRRCSIAFPHALIILTPHWRRPMRGCTRRRSARRVEAPHLFHRHAAGRQVRHRQRDLRRFTLVITDFGIPKVIGGQFNVLATDIFKQVVGQRNF